jgi:excisionase family DNA binding protein
MGLDGIARERQMSLLRAREAAEYLNVSLATLGRMEKEGELTPFRTPGGHRRYNLEMLNEYLERSRQQSLPASPPPNALGDKLPDSMVRILVMNDEPDTIELIIDALHENSDVYEFASASTDYEVGAQVAVFRPDLVVLGITGPEASSHEVCKKIKSNPETEHIKVVGIVGSAENKKVEEMLRCGADDCLIKPLQIEELQRSVRHLTSKKARLDH